ncbi:MAG: substrate-binding protein [Motiliproteus sp.]
MVTLIRSLLVSLLVSLLFVLTTIISGCSTSDSQAPIRLGVVLPLSGTFQIYGQQGLNGLMLAVEQINAKGGVLGRPLELVVEDNNTNPAESVRLSRQLIQVQDVFALFGPVSSSARFAMQEVADKFQVPQFYGIDYEGRHFSRYLICYSTIPEHYINPLIPYLLETSGPNFYVFGYDYVWPHNMSERIRQESERLGGAIKGIEFTPFGVSDYSATFARIKASGADNLMLILPGGDGFNFLKQMRKFDFGREISTVAFAADESYLDAVDVQDLEGVLTALHFFSSWQSDSAKTFVDSYVDRFGSDQPATYSSKSHYDMVYLLTAAIEKVGVVEREQVIDALSGLTRYNGKEQIKLREDHHFDLPMYLAQFKQGRLDVIKDLGRISPADQR